MLTICLFVEIRLDARYFAFAAQKVVTNFSPSQTPTKIEILLDFYKQIFARFAAKSTFTILLLPVLTLKHSLFPPTGAKGWEKLVGIFVIKFRLRREATSVAKNVIPFAYAFPFYSVCLCSEFQVSTYKMFTQWRIQ